MLTDFTCIDPMGADCPEADHIQPATAQTINTAIALFAIGFIPIPQGSPSKKQHCNNKPL
jgi:hypothetical protein